MDPSRFVSLERSIRRLITWNLLLGVVFLVSLGANAAWVQAAADPPIRVYTATTDDIGGGGSSSVGGQIIFPTYTADSPLTLLSITADDLSLAHEHTCLVTASVIAVPASNPLSSAAAVLGLSNRVRIRPQTERVAHLVITPDQDPEIVEVSTTYAFRRVTHARTFRFSVYWTSVAGSTGNLIVAKPSMTVVCLRDLI